MIEIIAATSSISVLFACVSVVSGVTLAILVLNDSRRSTNNNSMMSFNRHLDALSDNSRSHLRQQLRDAQDRKNKG